MKKSYLLITIAAVGLMIFGAGCGKSAAEKAVEEAAERASNGTADVDISGEDVTVTINTNEGTFTGTSGDSVELPGDFPSDVYVIDGTIKTAVTKTEVAGYTLSIATDKTIAEAKALYDTELAADGWSVVFSMDTGDGASISATKENRGVTVLINSDEGETIVMLGTSENEE